MIGLILFSLFSRHRVGNTTSMVGAHTDEMVPQGRVKLGHWIGYAGCCPSNVVEQGMDLLQTLLTKEAQTEPPFSDTRYYMMLKHVHLDGYRPIWYFLPVVRHKCCDGCAWNRLDRKT